MFGQIKKRLEMTVQKDKSHIERPEYQRDFVRKWPPNHPEHPSSSIATWKPLRTHNQPYNSPLATTQNPLNIVMPSLHKRAPHCLQKFYFKTEQYYFFSSLFSIFSLYFFIFPFTFFSLSLSDNIVFCKRKYYIFFFK